MPPQGTTAEKVALLFDGWDEVFANDPQAGVKPKLAPFLRRLMTTLERKKCVRRLVTLYVFTDWWTWLRALLEELCDEVCDRCKVGRYSLWTGLAPPQEPRPIPRI